MAVNRNERRVVFIRHWRALLEVKRENCELFFAGFLRGLPAGKAPQLKKLPAIFLAVEFVGEQRVKKIVFPRFNGRIGVVGKKRRKRPGFFRILLLVVEKRPADFGALAGIQRQWELIVKQPGMKAIFRKADGGRKSQRQNQKADSQTANKVSKIAQSVRCAGI